MCILQVPGRLPGPADPLLHTGGVFLQLYHYRPTHSGTLHRGGLYPSTPHTHHSHHTPLTTHTPHTTHNTHHSHHTPLTTHHSQHTTHTAHHSQHTPLTTHHSQHTTHNTPLTPHTTHNTPLTYLMHCTVGRASLVLGSYDRCTALYL